MRAPACHPSTCVPVERTACTALLTHDALDRVIQDIYRLINHVLEPLAPSIGTLPYADRIHAAVAAKPPILSTAQRSGGRLGAHRNEKWRRAAVLPHGPADATAPASSPILRALPAAQSDVQLLRLIHLCDATLPTGGFAHSGGLEAALQLGLLGSRGPQMSDALCQMGIAIVGSALQQQAPFAHAMHTLFTDALGAGLGEPIDAPSGAFPQTAAEEALAEAVAWLHAEQHKLLALNAPGCRASLQVGAALGRITRGWISESGAALPPGAARAALAVRQRGTVHSAPALGALAALLSLPQRSVTNALLYCTARDFFSAAVRLNLVGRPTRASCMRPTCALIPPKVASSASHAPTSASRPAGGPSRCGLAPA